MQSHFSEQKDLSYDASAPRDQYVSGKIGEASPAGYTHGKAAQRSAKDHVV